MSVFGKTIVLSLSVLLMLTGCQKAPELATANIPKPVSVKEASVEAKTTYITYVGIIKSETLKKVGFTVGGRLSTVAVKKGESVKKGQLLAVLEKHQYQIGVDASKAQVSAARLVSEKALEALNYLKKQLQSNKVLLQEGAVSQSVYDELALKANVAEKDYKASLAQLEQASAGLKNSSSTLSDTRLISDLSGKVVDILYKEGEIVGAGYPVVILQNEDQVFSFGIGQKDYQTIKLGMETDLEIDGLKIKGKIVNISEMPDQTTRTYETHVLLEKGTMPLGAIGEVKIANGQIKGVVVPLNVILSGEYDFVFVVENSKAVKKKIEIIQVHENNAIITGIGSGEKIVVSGVKNIDNADDVKVQ